MALWRSLLVAAAFTLIEHPALAQTAAPAGAEVYIIYPRDGQKIKGAFTADSGSKGWASLARAIRHQTSGTIISSWMLKGN